MHAVIGVALIAANALAAGWGIAAWARREPSVWFWYLLRVAQAAVVVEAALGLVLLAQDRSADGLHYVYGVAPLVVSLVTEGMRVGAAQRELEEIEGDLESLEHREQVLLARRIVMREIGVMSIGTLLVVTLMLRAVGSVL